LEKKTPAEARHGTACDKNAAVMRNQRHNATRSCHKKEPHAPSAQCTDNVTIDPCLCGAMTVTFY
jgi:hypothetical protein